MTIHSVQLNPSIESTHKSSSKASIETLYDLKHNPHRVERFKELYKNCSGEDFNQEYFSKTEELCLPFF